MPGTCPSPCTVTVSREPESETRPRFFSATRTVRTCSPNAHLRSLLPHFAHCGQLWQRPDAPTGTGGKPSTAMGHRVGFGCTEERLLYMEEWSGPGRTPLLGLWGRGGATALTAGGCETSVSLTGSDSSAVVLGFVSNARHGSSMVPLPLCLPRMHDGTPSPRLPRLGLTGGDRPNIHDTGS